MLFLFGGCILFLALEVGIIDAIGETAQDDKNADCGEYVFCSIHDVCPLFACTYS